MTSDSPSTKYRFRNWSGEHRCRPRFYHQPASEEAIVALVGRVAAAGETLRAVGAGHSWNDIVCTGAHLLNLDRYQEVLQVDRERRRVTVQAGIRLRTLIARLRTEGLALSNLGSVAEQSLAGAIATGTHGSGARFGNLPSQVVALRLVDGTGRIHELSAENDPERFRAARVGLGCLGIVSTVTLQCEPDFLLDERRELLPFDEATARLEELATSDEHVKLWWLPHTEQVLVCRAHRTSEPRAPGSATARRLDQSGLLRAVFATILRAGRTFPRFVPALNRWVKNAHFKPLRRIDHGDRIFNLSMPPRHAEMEYTLARPSAGEALKRVRALIDDSGLRVNFIVEVRFVAGDDALLSPDYGRDGCWLGAYIYFGESQAPYFTAFETLLLEYGGRPHWGKTFHLDHATLRSLYPQFDRFAAIRRELDPANLFVNDYIRRVFALDGR